MQKYNTIKNIKYLFNKLSIVIIALIFLLIYIKSLLYKIRIENKVIRFIKHKKNKNLLFYNFEKEIPDIKNYVKSLKERNFRKIIYYTNINKIKVSFIGSVYNKESYLKSFILSIQNQDLKEYELILVDDCSTDKSTEIISIFQKNDKRIKLIKIKNNSGTLYTRYIGALYSKGEYIIFADTDVLF